MGKKLFFNTMKILVSYVCTLPKQPVPGRAILRKVKFMAITTYYPRYSADILESTFHTTKKTVQEYVREIDRYCRFKSVRSQVAEGVILDDRGKLIDLYESCLQSDAHLAGVLETLYSQILGERYILAKQTAQGRYVADHEETKKIRGTQFNKCIKGIVDSIHYGFTGIEILDEIDADTGKLKNINIIERRNILPDQRRIVQRQNIWNPGWNFDDPQYRDNYILVNSGGLGLFSATTPLILAKKFTFANYVNFSHTYGQPIIHGKLESELTSDRNRFAHEIANAAMNKIVVTGLNDEVDVKTFASVNSEKIFTGLIAIADKDVSNLILGSESMAGATQSYVGATRAHQDVFRDRIAMYRDYIENVMNELVLPRLVAMGYIKPGLEFMYSKRLEMSNKDQIDLYTSLLGFYEIDSEEIEKAFGIVVGRQLNLMAGGGTGAGGDADGYGPGVRHLSDEEYMRRYGHPRQTTNFLRGR